MKIKNKEQQLKLNLNYLMLKRFQTYSLNSLLTLIEINNNTNSKTIVLKQSYCAVFLILLFSLSNNKNIAEKTTTILKLLKSMLIERTGKTIKLEIKSAPTNFILTKNLKT